MRRAERRRRLLEAGKSAARSGAGTEGPDSARKRASMPPPEGVLLSCLLDLCLQPLHGRGHEVFPAEAYTLWHEHEFVDSCGRNPIHRRSPAQQVYVGCAGGRHLMRDTRRTESDSASCSTAVIGEEPALRPAGVSLALRSAALSLTDGEQSLTADESALSAEIESVDTEPSADEASPADPAAAAVPPPFLFGKPKRVPSGQSAPGGADMESAEGSALGQQDGADGLNPSENGQARYMESDGGDGEYPSLATDPDFNALLEDIATGPLHGGTAASGTTPGTAEKAPALPSQDAAAAPKDAMAAASGTRKILAKLKPNPLRGFLSRKLPAEKKPATAEPPPTPSAPKPLPADTAPAAHAMSGPQPPQEQPQEQPHALAERTSSGDSSQHAVQDPENEASRADKYAAHEAENGAQLQQEEAEEVLGMAMSWLRGMYLSSATNDDREFLPASVAFDHIATLLPGALRAQLCLE